jgi:serine protease Do
MGIVSATGRGGLGIEDYEDFIQTDASINPGNSGGALINTRGELIGVNTAILSPSGGNLGIGFAVPSNMARSSMEQIVKYGKVTRGYMGVSIQDITPELAAAMKLGETHGALVGDVDPDGPAARAGLQKGDVIVGVNGKPVDDSRALRLMVSAIPPGSSINLRFMHDGQMRDAAITLGEMPAPQAAANTREKPTPNEPSPVLIGVAVADLTPEIAQRLNLPANMKGIVIADVQEGSPAAEAGLQPGDVIQEVNRTPIRNVGEFHTQLSNSKKGKDPVLLLVNREGRTFFAAIQQ